MEEEGRGGAVDAETRAQLVGMRAEINGLVGLLEKRNDVKKSTLRLLQICQRRFVESAQEWENDEKTHVELSDMLRDAVFTSYKRYHKMLMKTLGFQVEEEPVTLRV